MYASRAVILAAGNGKRMGRLTADRPKAMLDIDGQSLIERSVDALASCGIGDVTVVCGYRQERLREHLGERVRFVENRRFRETNSLYSLWLARERLLDGAVVMNSDVLVSPGLLHRLVAVPAEDAALVDETSSLDDEVMKVKIWHGFAVEFSKELAPWDANAENVGVLKFGARGGRRLAGHLDRLVAENAVNAWAPMAFAALAKEWPLRAVDTAGLPWTEVDFPADLDRARQMAAEAIDPAAARRAA